jgi:hypothetical protein
MSAIDFYQVLVTPTMAAALLEQTPHARPINAARVRRYADDMLAGRWRTNTAEAIKLTVDGVVVNGHHRLRAVVLSGVATAFHAARGVSPDVLEVLDSGMSVRTSDWSGRHNANRGFAMLNSILRAFGIATPAASRGCLQEMWDAIGDEHIQFGAQVRSRLVDAPGSMAVACVHRVDVGRAEVMRDRLLQATSLPANSPEQAWLRARSNRTYTTVETSIMGMRIALAAVGGEEIKVLSPRVNEKDAERALRLTAVLNIKRGVK